eukprot:jgi/Mesen1/2468/ME000158S01658
MARFSIKTLLLVAGCIRVVMIVFGLWQDANLKVKYTDIDYWVFTDAAKFVTQGLSPFQRYTYRYSPLLAYLLVPNVLVHQCFGKLLFSAAELVVGYQTNAILLQRGVPPRPAAACVAAWLFNPFTFTVATRHIWEGAVWYGLAVHVRIYPIIYALPILLLLNSHYPSVAARLQAGSPKEAPAPAPIRVPATAPAPAPAPALAPALAAAPPAAKPALAPSATPTSCTGTGNPAPVEPSAAARWLEERAGGGGPPLRALAAGWAGWAVGACNRERVVFSLVSGCTFACATGAFYWLYGWEYLHEALLYHLTRSDPRHNFSIYFYPIYLRIGKPAALFDRWMAFVPQLVVQLTLAARFSRDLPFCFFAQTVAFVAFNKVITAQYFVWFFCLLPLVLPSTTIRFQWRGCALSTLWVAAQLHWLFWGYLLEFEGRNVLLPLWMASIVFFAANVFVLGQLIRHHRVQPLFHDGKFVQLAHWQKKND